MPTVKLTDTFIKGCKCNAGVALVEFRDTDARGLELRVSAKGKKTWRLHYTRRSDGKRRAVGLGTYPDLSLKEARAKARGMQGTIENAEVRADPAARVLANRGAETFAEIAEVWMERHAVPNKGARTISDDRSMLRMHILPEIGAMKAVEITKRDIIRLLDEVAAKLDARTGDGDSGRRMTHRPNRVFELVRSIFRWAVGRDLVQVDPTWGLQPPIKKEQERERNLSLDEIKTLWAALNSTPAKRRVAKDLPRGTAVVGVADLRMTRAIAIALKLALVTGQRISEISGIHKNEFDFTPGAAVWTIPGTRTKNKKRNRVPLASFALQVIAEADMLSGGSEWLFPSPTGEGPIRADAATKAVARSSEALGIHDFRLHDLRRTAASRMAEMQISPHTISLILNHASARKGTVTSAVYIQYSYDKEKREALERWGQLLNRTVG
ncbi:MAG: tyrosine-type recombinase/integrase [Alphaproteobacteria bacterium]|nr:tyrosine-type recombinase/integrase [Alphaproteobacteria bacterium]